MCGVFFLWLLRLLVWLLGKHDLCLMGHTQLHKNVLLVLEVEATRFLVAILRLPSYPCLSLIVSNGSGIDRIGV